jgi:hypothetical protein
MSDGHLWHIAIVTNRPAGGLLFDVGQYDCVTAIRASFIGLDARRLYGNARGGAGGRRGMKERPILFSGPIVRADRRHEDANAARGEADKAC